MGSAGFFSAVRRVIPWDFRAEIDFFAVLHLFGPHNKNPMGFKFSDPSSHVSGYSKDLIYANLY